MPARLEATVSQHPLLPQEHGNPFGSTCTCPNSPAKPPSPRRILPLAKMPVPSPSDTFTTTRSCIPSLKPNQTSDNAQALATLSTTTGRPVACSTRDLMLPMGQLMLGAKMDLSKLDLSS